MCFLEAPYVGGRVAALKLFSSPFSAFQQLRGCHISPRVSKSSRAFTVTKAEVQSCINRSGQRRAKKCVSGGEAPGSGPVGVGGIWAGLGEPSGK